MIKILRLVFISTILVLVSAASLAAELQPQTIRIGGRDFTVRVPSGYELSLLTPDLEGPRVIHRHQSTLLIGSKTGAVYQLLPPYNKPVVVAALRDYPHSVVVHEGYLYVAHTSGVVRTPWPLTDRKAEWPLSRKHFEPVVNLPGGRGHNSRTLKVGPDANLYVSLGITGNCSDEFVGNSYPENDRRGGFFKISMNPNSAQNSDDTVAKLEPFASGLRNPVGFDWHPKTGVMYASNNGPDHLGYELPRESFAKIEAGSFHGMPWFQWDGDQLMQDPCISSEPPFAGSEVKQPVATFPARIAPMDVGFVNTDAKEGEAWAEFNHDAVVALHGSWATSDGGGGGDPASRREPMIVRVEFNKEGKSTGKVHSLVEGFQLEDGQRWARPMGIAFTEDGSLLFTSDGGMHGLFLLKASSASQ